MDDLINKSRFFYIWIPLTTYDGIYFVNYVFNSKLYLYIYILVKRPSHQQLPYTHVIN